MDLVSIILPVYNRRPDLEKSIKSVINQSYSNWELIIIDNFSSDGSFEFSKSIDDRRVKVLQLKNHGSIAKSRNYGIKISKGDFLAFLDSDDEWLESKLEFCLKNFTNEIDLIYHNMFIKKKKYTNTQVSFFRKLDNENIYLDLVNNGPAFPTSGVILKKKIFHKINYFNESDYYITWEDYDAWIRLSSNSCKFFSIKKPLGYIKISDNNTLTKKKRIENIYKFQHIYLNDKTLPNWCKISLIKDYYYDDNLKKIFDYLDFKLIKYLILNFKIKYIVLIFLIYLKKIKKFFFL